MAHILHGKDLSKGRAQALKERIGLFPTKPTLVIIQIGNVPESTVYVQGKIKVGKEIGAEVLHKQYAEEISEHELYQHIHGFNEDDSIHGIILQLPIPKHLHKDNLLNSIAPHKDVDGLTAHNIKQLSIDNTGIIPATTKGILTLLKEYHISLAGKHIVIVGRSNLVGKPTMLACVNEHATVTLCNSHTQDLEYHTKSADVIISATGARNLITHAHVKEGQVVIDVGIHAVPGEVRKIRGDVSFDEVEPVVAYISPVPGGVGPMTIISLFENLVDAYKKALG